MLKFLIKIFPMGSHRIHFKIEECIFLTYINDLPLTINSGKIIIHADDTSISLSRQDELSINSAVKDNFKKINDWFPV